VTKARAMYNLMDFGYVFDDRVLCNPMGAKGEIFDFNTSQLDSDNDFFNGLNPTLHGSGQVQIFPNPAKDILQIEVAKMQSDGMVYIYNVQGQLIIKQALATQASTQLPVQNLTIGLYTYKCIFNNGYSQTGKITIDR
jgi:Secretion system C-terminal sorting domain